MSIPTTEHTPPQSLDGEQSTIGACLMSSEAVSRASEIIESKDDFYLIANRKIWEIISDLSAQGTSVDLITVSQELHRRKWYEEVGGTAYLMACVENCPVVNAVDAYAQMVRDAAIERGLLQAADQTRRDVYNPEKTTQQKVDAAGARFIAFGSRRAGGGFEQVGGSIDAVFEQLEERRKTPGYLTGTPTGFEVYDRLTGGLQKGEMTIWAARPAMGKTSLAMQVALNIATGGQLLGQRFEPVPVAFISLEMSKEMLLRRLIAQVSGVDGQDLARGWLGDEDFERARGAYWLIRKAPLFLDDARDSTTFQLLARTRRLALEAGNPGAIFVDYLQLARTAGKAENRIQEISEIGKAFRLMAQQFNCPVIALSQLSRAVESREDKRPMLSDLRESGTIEQDADNVAFIYRDAYYKAMKGKGEVQEHDLDPTAEIIIGKQRNGPTGTVKLYFFKEQARFANMQKDAQ